MSITDPPTRGRQFGPSLRVRLTRLDFDRLNRLALDRSMSVSDLVREILAAALDSSRVHRTTSGMKRPEVARD